MPRCLVLSAFVFFGRIEIAELLVQKPGRYRCTHASKNERKMNSFSIESLRPDIVKSQLRIHLTRREKSNSIEN